jgi:hypothetical protein
MDGIMGRGGITARIEKNKTSPAELDKSLR